MGSPGEATRSPRVREFRGGGENGLRAPFILDSDTLSGWIMTPYRGAHGKRELRMVRYDSLGQWASDAAFAAQATVWEVTSPADDETQGTLRHAVQNATAGNNMIVIDPDVFRIELTSVLVLTKKLYIIGPCVIAQKDAAEGILAISPEGDVTLSHVTLSGGSGDPGIAVRNEGRLVMTRCSLLRNSAAFGGGSVCNRGTMTMEGCAIAWNSGDLSGGGILNYGTLTFSGCVLQENVSRPVGDAEPAASVRTGVPGGDSPHLLMSRWLRSSKRRLTLTRCQGVSFPQMMMRSGSGTQVP